MGRPRVSLDRSGWLRHGGRIGWSPGSRLRRGAGADWARSRRNKRCLSAGRDPFQDLALASRALGALVALLIFLVFAGAFVLGMYVGDKVDRELASAAAVADRDDPYWRIRDVLAHRATVPDAENAALVVTKAAGLLPKYGADGFTPTYSEFRKTTTYSSTRPRTSVFTTQSWTRFTSLRRAMSPSSSLEPLRLTREVGTSWSLPRTPTTLECLGSTRSG